MLSVVPRRREARSPSPRRGKPPSRFAEGEGYELLGIDLKLCVVEKPLEIVLALHTITIRIRKRRKRERVGLLPRPPQQQ